MSKDTKKDSPASNAKGSTSSNKKNTTNDPLLQYPEFSEYIITDPEDDTKEYTMVAFNGNSYSVLEEVAVKIYMDRYKTYWYSNGLDRKVMSLRQIAFKVIELFNFLINTNNEVHERMWRYSKELSPVQAALIISEYEIIRMVLPEDLIDNPESEGVCAYYVDSGQYEGTYRQIGRGQIDIWASALEGAAKYQWKKEFLEKIIDISNRKENRVFEEENNDLVFMQNTIFDCRNKKFIGFSPDYISLRKHKTFLPPTCPPLPTHVMKTESSLNGSVITFWQWLESLAPYEGGVDYLVKVAGAALRHKFNWGKMFVLTNRSGKNGKGTFLHHIKSLIGMDGIMITELATLTGNNPAGRFGLSEIVGKAVALCEDESDVYLEDLGRFKSITRQDNIRVERKGKDSFNYKAKTIILVAANNVAKMKDKTQAVLDRLTLIPFTGRFDGKDEDKSIKDEWIVSKEFCSYMAYQALVEMPYFESLPYLKEVDGALKEFRKDNDPIVEFYEDYMSEMIQSFVSTDTIWYLYQDWLKVSRPSTQLPSRKTFITRLYEIADETKEWIQANDGNKVPLDKWFYPTRIDGRDYYPSGQRVRGLVRKKMWDYCVENKTTPADLSGQYMYICKDLEIFMED